MPIVHQATALDKSSQQTTIATVVIQSGGDHINKDRTQLLGDLLRQLRGKAAIVLLPGGFYDTGDTPRTLYQYAEDSVKQYLQEISDDTVICLGIDGRDGKDQIGLAINQEGIKAIGRKFHSAAAEDMYTEKADSEFTTEDGYHRSFVADGKSFFLAVCYDSFGIKKRHLQNPGVDVILNLVHGFQPRGEKNSGEVYFAKHGFIGASKQWKCPTFGAAVFFKRPIPIDWPTGVMWNQGNKTTQEWKYRYNPLSPTEDFEVNSTVEKARIRIFAI